MFYENNVLKSDGHKFHQYQQNEQSPLILTELTEHKAKKDHDIWRWKSKFWLGTGKKMHVFMMEGLENLLTLCIITGSCSLWPFIRLIIGSAFCSITNINFHRQCYNSITTYSLAIFCTLFLSITSRFTSQ